MRTILSVLSLVALCAAEMHACTAAILTPKSAFHEATAVFTAEVLSYTDGIVRVRVIESFKGGPVTTFATLNDEGACGYGPALAAEREHLFYAHSEEGKLVVSTGRTKPLSTASSEVKLLRQRAWWWRTSLSQTLRYPGSRRQ